MPIKKKRFNRLAIALIFILILAGIAGIKKYKTDNQNRLPLDITEEKPTTLEDWKKQYPQLKKYVFETKPINLPANLQHPGMMLVDDFKLPQKAWVIGFEPEVVNGPPDLLHHVDLIDSGYSYFCKGRMPNIIVASGEELNEGFAPLGYGYPTRNGNTVSSIMYHNEHPDPHSDVRLRLTFWYLQEKDTTLKNHFPLFLDVLGACQWGDYFIPPKSSKVNTLNPAYVVEKSGKILLIGPHAHHYAETFEVLLNGRLIKSLNLEHDEKGEDKHAIPIIRPKNLYVKKGDKLQLRVTYNNTTDSEIDAMGQAMFYIAPDQ